MTSKTFIFTITGSEIIQMSIGRQFNYLSQLPYLNGKHGDGVLSVSVISIELRMTATERTVSQCTKQNKIHKFVYEKYLNFFI